ncbi:GspE/PulE family protein [Clostridium baratii]|uniref:Type II secretory pathway, ATPase PulE/Tfp pilus assembly pathway, ATPase PilB n=1 Tax=Clostridium baratii TaxID=1561 RepID=A0A174V543_9CLOT|nr:GspE/PulE family protein [Clostridium baratii]CUQ27238.1 type II secretory pathway%2C ATPase PulE/Tfp pilus assembly pathway%2C ATPase PilB [Clostridium baratii]
MKTKMRLGDILVKAGKITHTQLVDALRRQAIEGRRLGEILLEEKLVTEEDILTVLELQLDIERVNLDYIDYQDEAIRKVPENLCKQHNIIPFKIEGNNIHVAMSNPSNIMIADDIKLITGLNTVKYLASEDEIKKAIESKYKKQYAEKVARDLIEEEMANELESKKQNQFEESEETKDAPVVKLVNTIIGNAVILKASDIHIEPFEDIVRIRARVDGQLQKMLEIPKNSHNSLVTRIKILANLNIAEKRVPQDGRILTRVNGKEVDLRVSVLPTINGEKVVIRILARNMELIDKQKLGMRDDDLVKLESILSNPYGIILVTGPTGSGKSTTLYAVLSELNTIQQNIITVEDPVEFSINGINQVNVNVKAGLTFASGLRSILRQDPDVIMVGEIRDGETAEIAVRASITGHVVLSTLHTNDAPSTVARLVDMGIEPYLISTSVTGIIAQRLVRKNCPKCSKEYEPKDREREILGLKDNEDIKLIKGEGCPYCNGTGYKGRVGIYEILDINKEVRETISLGENSDKIRECAIKNGMKTLKDACVEHVLEGITTVDELMRVAFLKE